METIQASGAATSESSATEEIVNDSVDTKPVQDSSPDLQRIKDDMLKYKREAQDLKKTLEGFKSQKLKEQNDFKTLYEQSSTELEMFKNGYMQEKKREALRSAAHKLGLREEAAQDLELLGLDSLTEELTTEGRVIIHGAEDFAQQLKKQRAYWFKSEQAPKFNSGGGAQPDSPQDLSAQYMIGLEKKDPKKYKELYPKFVAQLRTRKSG